MDMIAQLQSHPMFSTFTPEQLSEVVRIGECVTYEPGDVCIRQEDPGEIFGVLVSGRLEALRNCGADHPEHLGYIEAGECFGEMSMLTGNTANADVVADERSEAIVFLQEAIAPIVAENRQAVQFLTRLITLRLSVRPEKHEPSARRSVHRYSLGASSLMRVLAVSVRQDDVRYSYYETTSSAPRIRGAVTGLSNGDALHTFEGPGGKREIPIGNSTLEAALEAVLDVLKDPDEGGLTSLSELSGIGHRVVHGGIRFNGPAVVDEEVKDEIRRLIPLAPLDNEYNLRGIEICEKLAPQVTQIAVFDTSFHLKTPPAAHRYALPASLSEDPELRKFGFHGISHEGAGRAAAEMLNISFDSLRMITCHLGAGASLAAIDHGRSVDNTMGLTPLDGLVMGTRPGDLDPGLVLYVLQQEKLSPQELTWKLYRESGLLGLSGISSDVQEIIEAANQGDPKAMLALQVYCRRGKKYLGSYLGLLGGADAIVFTGGVGTNESGIRARFCQGLECFGVSLDEELNRSASVRPGQVAEISETHSRVRVLVVGSDEERSIAYKTVRAISQKPVTDVMRGKNRKIPIGISAHHVHLTQEHVETLFGEGHTLTWYADLTQPGQYACEEHVNLIGPKGRIDRVRVLGPVRSETQVEISRTEEFKLGIDAPIRMSGDLDGTPGITMEGPEGQIRIEQGVICAMRHIHMSPADAIEFATRHRDIVRVRISGPRSLVYGDVGVRVDPNFRLDMHIDTDEANAAELENDSCGYLDSIQQRAGV